MSKFIVISLLFFSSVSFACEPVLPLIKLFSYSHFLLASSIGLAITVALKCTLFSFIEKSMTKKRSFWTMFFGNLLTSIFGLLAILGMTSSPGLIIVSIIFYFLALLPVKELKARSITKWKLIQYPYLTAFIVSFSYFLTLILWGIAGEVLEAGNIASYWTLKLMYIYVSLILSIGITILWEEWIVFKFSKSVDKTSFFPTVTRANLITMVVLIAYPAIQMLPQRIGNPGFLTWIAGF